jgi:hypothetical protein
MQMDTSSQAGKDNFHDILGSGGNDVIINGLFQVVDDMMYIPTSGLLVHGMDFGATGGCLMENIP